MVRDSSGWAGKGPGNIPSKKSRYRSTRGTALGFAIFPMIFTYERDVGVINSDVIIRFSLMAGKLSPSIKIILGIQCD